MIRRNRVNVMNRRRFESKRKRFEARDSSGVFYKAWNAWFEMHEDDYESGELDLVGEWDVKCACTAKTLPELIKKVQSKLGMDGKDFYWAIDVDGSSLRVNYVADKNDNLASKSDIEAWKNGEITLYNVDGGINIQKVMGESDVPEDELEDVARKMNMDTM